MKVSIPAWFSGLVVLCLAPFFFLGGPDFYSPELVKNVWDFGHIIFFTVLLLWVQLFRPLVKWYEWLWATAIVLALGGAIETVQYFVGRSASWIDIFHNLTGVWLGLFWGQKPNRQIVFLRIASLGCVLPSVWLIINSAWADVTMRIQFPVINSFESSTELAQVRVNRSTAVIRQQSSVVHHGSSALEVQLSTQRYAGVRLLGPYGDWGKYQFLVMDFYNPDTEPLVLALKISDYQHDIGANQDDDRFNRPITLTQGWNEIRINIEDLRTAPKERDMELRNITGFAVFAVGLPAPRILYWDNIRLE